MSVSLFFNGRRLLYFDGKKLIFNKWLGPVWKVLGYIHQMFLL